MNYFMMLEKKQFLYSQECLYKIVVNIFENFDVPVLSVKVKDIDITGAMILEKDNKTLNKLVNMPEHLKELNNIAFEITNSLIYANAFNKLANELSEQEDTSFKLYSGHMKIYERNIYLKNAISSIFTFREQLAFLFNEVCGQCISDKTKISFNNFKNKLKLSDAIEAIKLNCLWLNLKEIESLKKIFDELSSDEIKELIEVRHTFSHRTSFAVGLKGKINYKKSTVNISETYEVKELIRNVFMNDIGSISLSTNPDNGQVESILPEYAERNFEYDDLYFKVISIWEKIIYQTTNIINYIDIFNMFIEKKELIRK